MEIIKNLDVILSVICSICSIIMFYKAKREKDECIKIRTDIQNNLKITSTSKEIKSRDNFHINSVQTFENGKSIR